MLCPVSSDTGTAVPATLKLNGIVSFHNTYGYLPSEVYGVLPFMASLSPIHHIFLCIVLYCAVESAVWFAAYSDLNTRGEPQEDAEILQIPRLILTHILLLLISQGYGTVQPVLAAQIDKLWKYQLVAVAIGVCLPVWVVFNFLAFIHSTSLLTTPWQIEWVTYTSTTSTSLTSQGGATLLPGSVLNEGFAAVVMVACSVVCRPEADDVLMHNDSIQLRTSEEEEEDSIENDDEEEGINMLHINVKKSGSGLKSGQNNSQPHYAHHPSHNSCTAVNSPYNNHTTTNININSTKIDNESDCEEDFGSLPDALLEGMFENKQGGGGGGGGGGR
eukprot:gene26551-33149_t